MTTTRTEQEQLLAVHRRQFDGYMKTIASIEAAKTDGSIDAELADAQIERWSIYAAATQSDIDDCLRNIAELDADQTPFYEMEPVEVVRFEGVDSADRASVTFPVEPTIVDDEATDDDAPKRGRKAAQP